jgi:hypothetical protein
MCGSVVRRGVWVGEAWRSRENGSGLEEEGTGEDVGGMKGAEERGAEERASG